jgi:uncharacterized protein YdhG (YjbR/CyaY superfamily)
MWTCQKRGRDFDREAPRHLCDSGADVIERYIIGQAEDVQPRLRDVYAALKAALPNTTEKISYNMPTFWQGGNIIHFAAFKKHIGIFPGGEATTVFADKLTGFETTKGGIRLPYNKPLPIDIITEIALWCGKENAK